MNGKSCQFCVGSGSDSSIASAHRICVQLAQSSEECMCLCVYATPPPLLPLLPRCNCLCLDNCAAAWKIYAKVHSLIRLIGRPRVPSPAAVQHQTQTCLPSTPFPLLCCLFFPFFPLYPCPFRCQFQMHLQFVNFV